MWQMARSAALISGCRPASMGPKSRPGFPWAAASASAWRHRALCSRTSPVAVSVNERGGGAVVVVVSTGRGGSGRDVVVVSADATSTPSDPPVET